MKKLLHGVMFVAAVSPITGRAFEPYGATAFELAQLPQECRDKYQGKNSEIWSTKFGEGWLHWHHYCDGLRFIMRANTSTDKESRRYNLGVARGNFQYVLEHTSPNYFMRKPIEMQVRAIDVRLKQR